MLDLFRIGIGPSSSHTVGPMRLAKAYAKRILEDAERHPKRVEVQLQGSLALTGKGHGTDRAVILGLAGFDPETMDPDAADDFLGEVESRQEIPLAGKRDETLAFDPSADIVFAYDIVPDLHPNAMRVRAWDAKGEVLLDETGYSIGGGFIATAEEIAREEESRKPNSGGHGAGGPFVSAEALLRFCDERGIGIAEAVVGNEDRHRAREETEAKLDIVVGAMNDCIDRGLRTQGILPGGLEVRRRAPELWDKLKSVPQSNEMESLFDWLNVYALAVNEENAAGGRVVTAPTNGAAGIVPAVMRHYSKDAAQARCFLLTAGGIGMLYKQRASISGAEMGCQGEVGVASSMAAGALAAIWGGTPGQVAVAAEIAMEHNLGLTCDPVGGLVQIPCIERNAIGAVKAVNAARLALHSEHKGRVSLDQVIETMRQTGHDMSTKYKETSQGGLAVNVVEC